MVLALAWVVAGTRCWSGAGTWASGWEMLLNTSWNALLARTLSVVLSNGFSNGIEWEPLVPTMSQNPNVWCDGSRVTNEVAQIDCVGAEVFAAWIHRK